MSTSLHLGVAASSPARRRQYDKLQTARGHAVVGAQATDKVRQILVGQRAEVIALDALASLAVDLAELLRRSRASASANRTRLRDWRAYLRGLRAELSTRLDRPRRREAVSGVFVHIGSSASNTSLRTDLVDGVQIAKRRRQARQCHAPLTLVPLVLSPGGRARF